MKLKAVIDFISKMRDRDQVKAVISAAEDRECHLAGVEQVRGRNAAWDRLMSHGIKAGDTVFVHLPKAPQFEKGARLFGKPLRVVAVRPRKKEIVVSAPGFKGTDTLSALAAVNQYGISKEPTTEAFSWALLERK